VTDRRSQSRSTDTATTMTTTIVSMLQLVAPLSCDFVVAAVVQLLLDSKAVFSQTFNNTK
jgi:hypothetical protein